MAKTLYPLKFHPICKQLIWGGEKLRESYGKAMAPEKTGESWEISCVEDNVSIASNGFLNGRNLIELIEEFKGELVGTKIFERFGSRFPILTKFIHSNDDLSIQVHPGDEYAYKNHGENGKTEMWYILESEKEARLIVGFNREMDRDTLIEHINHNSFKDILNYESVSEGDVILLSEGRIHGLGPGIVLAEIQQTSDMTYRIYDWGRLGNDGKPRELHIEHALNVLDYHAHPDYKIPYDKKHNTAVNLVDCPYFTTQVIHFDRPLKRDFRDIDSFVIYMCIKGNIRIRYAGTEEISLSLGESLLIPAVLKDLLLKPQENSSLLEIYLK